MASLPYDLSVGVGATAICAAGVTIGHFFSDRIAIDGWLTGRWEGDLRCQNPRATDISSHVIHCILVLARPERAGENSGLLYYDRQCTQQNIILTRGLDELQNYKRINGLIGKAKVEMAFVRRFHRDDASGKVDVSGEISQLVCHCINRKKMDVRAEIHAKLLGCKDVWEGTFTKR